MTDQLKRCERCNGDIKLVHGNYYATCHKCGAVIETPINYHPMRLEG